MDYKCNMDYNDYRYRSSPSYHNVMYAFQGPTGLDSQLSASAVSETHECLTDSRHTVSVGVLTTVAGKVINPTSWSEIKLFMLHNVDIQQFPWPENVRKWSLISYVKISLHLEVSLKSVISREISVYEYIASPGSQFEIGYFKGNKRVWVQNGTDTKEVQRLLQSGSQTVTLRCIGKYEPKLKL